MSNVSRQVELNVPAATAWKLVGNPESLSDWHPAIVTSPVNDGRRTCSFPDGKQIVESVASHDDANMKYTYTIVEGEVPMRDYVSTLEVVAIDDARCRLQWSATFEPLAPEAEVAGFVGGVYEAGLESVKARLAS